MRLLVCFFCFLGGLLACTSRMEALPDEPITFKTPANFPPPKYAIDQNPVTTAGFNLGKALFYDPILSKDNTISCESCHQQVAAFAHQGHDLSHGINGLLGKRNSPALINLAWNSSFFWDGGVHDLNLQPIAPIENPVEMDETMANVLTKLRNSPTYPAMFEKAFGSRDITTANTTKALAQFMVMLISANSKYDQFRRGEAVLTLEESTGMNIFRQKCGSCHAGELFTDNSFANNGLPLNPSPTSNDEGRFLITQQASDKYRFKVPTLRNIEKTAPYMHDGRILTLAGAIGHYAAPANTPNIDARLFQMPLGGLGVPLSPDERLKILAFLRTLTDNDFLQNPLFRQ